MIAFNENLLKALAKSVLMSLRVIAAASAIDAAIHKKMISSGGRSSDLTKWTILNISNEEMKDVMKTIKSLKESGLWIKGMSETIKNEAKEQKEGFFRMLLGTLGATLLENLLTGKGIIRAGESAVRAGQDF